METSNEPTALGYQRGKSKFLVVKARKVKLEASAYYPHSCYDPQVYVINPDNIVYSTEVELAVYGDDSKKAYFFKTITNDLFVAETNPMEG